MILCLIFAEIPAVLAETITDVSVSEEEIFEDEVAEDEVIKYRKLVRGDRDGDDSVAIVTLQNRLVELRTNNQDTVDRGLVGFYRGAKVKMSNNIFNDDTDDYVMLKTGKAIAYLNGIDKLEAYQPERRFSDAVKGLNTYGGKIIRQNEIAVLVCHQA